MKRYPSVFLSACAGMFLFGITLITLGSVAGDLREKFQLDGIAAGTLFSILPLGILLGSLTFGPICDRHGYKTLLIAACAGMATGFEGIAYSTSTGLLNLSVFVFGISGGVINGATNALVADISAEHKGANLSLLGVFFGLGALGMPLAIGVLSEAMTSFEVVATVGFIAFFVGATYLFVKFPPAKQSQQAPRVAWKDLFQWLLILISLFLFFQSSFEAIVNNWSTTYLTTTGRMSESAALYGLSLHIAGMVVMRLLTGTLLRRVSEIKIMWACLVMLAGGIFLMQVGQSAPVLMAGLVLSGAGLAEGFPLMLGFAGARYAQFSGTAFSFIFTIALIGNMSVNYITGMVVEAYGVIHLITVSYIEIAFMTLLFYFIIKKLKPTQ